MVAITRNRFFQYLAGLGLVALEQGHVVDQFARLETRCGRDNRVQPEGGLDDLLRQYRGWRRIVRGVRDILFALLHPHHGRLVEQGIVFRLAKRMLCLAPIFTLLQSIERIYAGHDEHGEYH